MKAIEDMTQKEMILQHLRLFGSITPLKALEEYGCYRLSAVIFELRELGRDYGFTIETKPLTRKNRFGKSVTFAEYFLIEGENE